MVACVDDKVTQGSSSSTESDGATATTDGATFADAGADDGFVIADGRLGDSGARPADGSLSDAQQGNPVDANGQRPSPPIALGGDRPANYFLPLNYDPDTPLPVVIALHGFSGNSASYNAYLRLGESAQALGLMLILADGRRNRAGNQFWSATDFCCDLKVTLNTHRKRYTNMILARTTFMCRCETHLAIWSIAIHAVKSGEVVIFANSAINDTTFILRRVLDRITTVQIT